MAGTRARRARARTRLHGALRRRDVTVDSNEELVASARSEIAATLAPERRAARRVRPSLAARHAAVRAGQPRTDRRHRTPPDRAPGPCRGGRGLRRSGHSRLHRLGRAGRGEGRSPVSARWSWRVDSAPDRDASVATGDGAGADGGGRAARARSHGRDRAAVHPGRPRCEPHVRGDRRPRHLRERARACVVRWSHRRGRPLRQGSHR